LAFIRRFSDAVLGVEMKPVSSFRILLRRHGYSEKSTGEIWKWYDFSERRGAANF